MAARVLVPLADGVEEMEAVIAIDVLRRAGATVEVFGLGASDRGEARNFVVASRGVRLGHDGPLPSRTDADALVLPGGGPGAERLASDERIHEFLRAFEREGRLVGAICAAPRVLVAAGTFGGRTMTSHPSVEPIVRPFAGDYRTDGVVADGNLITARGPGVAFDFAFALVAALFGDERVAEVRAPMMFGNG